jgi:N-methylhydantoinase B/oxoprolinase/acetone carboxylase alpha subunit
MPLSVLAAVNQFMDPGSGGRFESFSMQDFSGTLPKLQGDLEAQEGLCPGDMIVLNDPFRGGTHLPDITLVTPVFVGEDTALSKDVEPRLYGFVASRAHHADVGGMTPGSMPVGREIFQEGLIIPPVKLMRRGNVDKGILELILACIRIDGENAQVDFSGSDRQQTGSVNAVYAITLSCVYYVFRSLLGLDVPNNSGCLKPIEVIAPPGTVVNALPPAAVAGGNVETSQRIVDVLLGALAKASPERVPAASQGTMNNVTIGGYDDQKKVPFAYYETIGGGMGARPDSDGPSAVHSHMTNTLNTPIEALEYAYPLRVLRYEVRRGSGGEGKFRGGDGIRRDVQVLVDSQVTLLSERRSFQPYGLNGGEPGDRGENVLIRDGEQIKLPGKGTFDFYAGDILSIRTPGGGGFGEKIQSKALDGMLK